MADEKSMLLVNDDNRTFRADDSSVVIWDLCDGKTLEELCAAVAEGIGVEPDSIHQAVESLISMMLDARLVEYID